MIFENLINEKIISEKKISDNIHNQIKKNY